MKNIYLENRSYAINEILSSTFVRFINNEIQIAFEDIKAYSNILTLDAEGIEVTTKIKEQLYIIVTSSVEGVVYSYNSRKRKTNREECYKEIKKKIRRNYLEVLA